MTEMDHKTVEEYVLSMPNAVLEYPFGEGVAVYKVFIPEKSSTVHASDALGAREKRTEPYKSTVKGASEQSNNAQPSDQKRVKSFALEQVSGVQGDWKMFALIAEQSDPLRISLKCDPQLAVILREKYETVMQGYHLNKKHWNTIILSGQLPWEEIQGFITHSYNLVTGKH